MTKHRTIVHKGVALVGGDTTLPSLAKTAGAAAWDAGAILDTPIQPGTSGYVKGTIESSGRAVLVGVVVASRRAEMVPPSGNVDVYASLGAVSNFSATDTRALRGGGTRATTSCSNGSVLEVRVATDQSITYLVDGVAFKTDGPTAAGEPLYPCVLLTRTTGGVTDISVGSLGGTWDATYTRNVTQTGGGTTGVELSTAAWTGSEQIESIGLSGGPPRLSIPDCADAVLLRVYVNDVEFAAVRPDVDALTIPGLADGAVVRVEALGLDGVLTTNGPTLTFGPPPPPTLAGVHNLNVSNITRNSAQIEWRPGSVGTPLAATGSIFYGVAADQRTSQTPEEEDFLLFHRQTISGLSPSITYHYQIQGYAESGEVYEHEGTFDTLAASNGGTGTPVPDGKRPLGGEMIGMRHGGLQTGNASIDSDIAFRFRAERTGQIDAVTFQNRLLSQGNIDSRSGAYQTCEDEGLGPTQCGYTLGNSYHVGTGGTLRGMICEDDGSGSHLPNESAVLAQMPAPFRPIDFPGSSFPTHSLGAGCYLEAGKLYHAVFINETPPPGGLMTNLSIEDARELGLQDIGAAGFNGTWTGDIFNESIDKWGPYLGRWGSGALGRGRNGDTQWDEAGRTIPFGGVRYTDGMWVGNFDAGFANLNNAAGNCKLNGQDVARQVFKCGPTNTVIDGIWIFISYARDTGTNGQPIDVKIQNANGSTLRTATVAASSSLHTYIQNGDALGDTNAGTWKFADLNSPLTLTAGATYAAYLSAASGANYRLRTYFSYGIQDHRDGWNDANGEASSNGGSSWSKAGYYTRSDLPIILTIEGQIRSRDA